MVLGAQQPSHHNLPTTRYLFHTRRTLRTLMAASQVPFTTAARTGQSNEPVPTVCLSGK